MSALMQSLQADVAGGIDQDREVVVVRQFGAGGIDTLDQDGAGWGNVAQLACGYLAGRPVVPLVAGGLAGGERGEHLIAQSLPVEVLVVALLRAEQQPVALGQSGGRSSSPCTIAARPGPPRRRARASASVDFPAPPVPSIATSANPERVRPAMAREMRS